VFGERIEKITRNTRGSIVVGVFYIFLSSEKHTPSKNTSERDLEELEIEERKQEKWV